MVNFPFLKHQPTKIIAVGLNYHDHARELGLPTPSEPIIFMKPVSSLIGPGQEIILPAMSGQVEYEAELACVIADRIKDVGEQQALSHVAGYICLNDVTARDLQRKDGQWTRAKSFDTFCPIGPQLAGGINPNGLDIELRLNGQTRQKSNTGNLIFKMEQLISLISKVMTLCPGDIISTGTPAGVGPMKSGDVVEVEIERIGVLKNRVL